ncbi:MAG: lytic transglycosylase domain-containing protein [Oscillospiraceae bacterium]|jgi:soluble lytic murein transglycosylase|nr:lytic transglycosylase domain-containing protein [Oscillospiraceae bacterium]MCI1990945.1 lytic transglycosylase domain-containing protein [Oscillospiraceae bacterium]MCI2035033.1 lytic transglycosylase domain-containing protein [Oscillospiraceae bacterium]
MKKHKKLLIVCAALAALVVAAVFLLRLCHTRFLQKMYPRTYSGIVEREARQNGLDPNLVYSVIRQESNFDPDVKSHAGAVGLMQLTPATFEWLQKREQAASVRSGNALYLPDVNIRYGCRFLSFLLKKYGRRRTALCAYNAGMGRVDSWLKDGRTSRNGKDLDRIPYPETRDYVRKVEQNYTQYRQLYQS